MKTVGTFEGKTQFSALIQAAARGESTIITHKGVPVAKIVPLDEPGADPHAALERILARKIRVGVSARELIDDGRKY